MHPNYLFNIAQCHRQLGELEAAPNSRWHPRLVEDLEHGCPLQPELAEAAPHSTTAEVMTDLFWGS